MFQPNFFFERKIWKLGYKVVAGCDEVGRGCFAGPIVAGCVAFPSKSKEKDFFSVKIDDSKKLSEKKRLKANEWIKDKSLVWGIGEVSATMINKIGMSKATKMAFRKAIANANYKLKNKNLRRIDYLLLDAFYIPYVRGIRMPLRKEKIRTKKIKRIKNPNLSGSQLAIVNGDEKSLSIAAASVIAKVYRDKLMIDLGKKLNFKKYGWENNKGYGTKSHRQAIAKYGISKYHRKIFVDSFFKNR